MEQREEHLQQLLHQFKVITLIIKIWIRGVNLTTCRAKIMREIPYTWPTYATNFYLHLQPPL